MNTVIRKISLLAILLLVGFFAFSQTPTPLSSLQRSASPRMIMSSNDSRYASYQFFTPFWGDTVRAIINANPQWLGTFLPSGAVNINASGNNLIFTNGGINSWATDTTAGNWIMQYFLSPASSAGSGQIGARNWQTGKRYGLQFDGVTGTRLQSNTDLYLQDKRIQDTLLTPGYRYFPSVAPDSTSQRTGALTWTREDSLKNGIYSGSNTVPSGTVATVAGNGFSFANQYGTLLKYDSTGVYNLGRAQKSDNTVFGKGALNKSNTLAPTGTTVFGNDAAFNATAGFNSTIMGVGAAYEPVNLVEMVVIGSYACYSAKDSVVASVAVGDLAGVNLNGPFNTVVGYKAALNNNTGGLNGGRVTAIGGQSLLESTTGRGNTCVGADCGRLLTVGNFNTGVGTFDYARVNESNSIILADGNKNVRFYGNSSGNISIGSSQNNIGARLGVRGSGTTTGQIVNFQNRDSVNRFVVLDNGGIAASAYLNSRDDTGFASNALATDASGNLQSHSLSETNAANTYNSSDTTQYPAGSTRAVRKLTPTFGVPNTNYSLQGDSVIVFPVAGVYEVNYFVNSYDATGAVETPTAHRVVNQAGTMSSTAQVRQRSGLSVSDQNALSGTFQVQFTGSAPFSTKVVITNNGANLLITDACQINVKRIY